MWVFSYLLLNQHIRIIADERVPSSEHYAYLAAGDVQCYCDETCIELGDCCSDYTFVCPRKFSQKHTVDSGNRGSSSDRDKMSPLPKSTLLSLTVLWRFFVFFCTKPFFSAGQPKTIQIRIFYVVSFWTLQESKTYKYKTAVINGWSPVTQGYSLRSHDLRLTISDLCTWRPTHIRNYVIISLHTSLAKMWHKNNFEELKPNEKTILKTFSMRMVFWIVWALQIRSIYSRRIRDKNAKNVIFQRRTVRCQSGRDGRRAGRMRRNAVGMDSSSDPELFSVRPNSEAKNVPD